MAATPRAVHCLHAQDMAAQYSPNGKRIAFESDRSGVYGIWISDADGSHAWNYFHRRRDCGTARWSPDGQRIAFDLIRKGTIDIYVIRASGGKPMPLTTDSAHDDGSKLVERWQVGLLYVQPDRSIRGMEGAGWRREGCPVTRNGGGMAFESPTASPSITSKETTFQEVFGRCR